MVSSQDAPTEDAAATIVAALDRIARGIRAHRQATATAAGLTPLQLDLLRTLAEAPPPRPAPGELATELGISQPTVTDSILALERKGCVERHPDPADRRRIEIVLTPSAAELVAEANRADEVLRDTFGALADADQERLLTALLESIGSLLDAGVIRVARTCPTCRFFHRSTGSLAWCRLLRAPLGAGDLRVNCAEHQPVDRE